MTVTTNDNSEPVVAAWFVPPAALIVGARLMGEPPPQPAMITSSKARLPADLVYVKRNWDMPSAMASDWVVAVVAIGLIVATVPQLAPL